MRSSSGSSAMRVWSTGGDQATFVPPFRTSRVSASGAPIKQHGSAACSSNVTAPALRVSAANAPPRTPPTEGHSLRLLTPAQCAPPLRLSGLSRPLQQSATSLAPAACCAPRPGFERPARTECTCRGTRSRAAQPRATRRTCPPPSSIEPSTSTSRELQRSSSNAALRPSATLAASRPHHGSSVAAGPWCFVAKKGQSGPRHAEPKWNCGTPFLKKLTPPLPKSTATPTTSPWANVGIWRIFSPNRRTVPGRLALPPLQATAFSLCLGSTLSLASGLQTPTNKASSTGCQTRTAKCRTPCAITAPTAPPHPLTWPPFVAVSESPETTIPVLAHASQPRTSPPATLALSQSSSPRVADAAAAAGPEAAYAMWRLPARSGHGGAACSSATSTPSCSCSGGLSSAHAGSCRGGRPALCTCRRRAAKNLRNPCGDSTPPAPADFSNRAASLSVWGTASPICPQTRAVSACTSGQHAGPPPRAPACCTSASMAAPSDSRRSVSTRSASISSGLRGAGGGRSCAGCSRAGRDGAGARGVPPAIGDAQQVSEVGGPRVGATAIAASEVNNDAA
mmetsp:Transcript_58783/g.165862  ORF Transcript_58783/g.165862 Transcript_58783/m.165862 type:complete len:566 (-) Transcript_58783:7-1704(-)